MQSQIYKRSKEKNLNVLLDDKLAIKISVLFAVELVLKPQEVIPLCCSIWSGFSF